MMLPSFSGLALSLLLLCPLGGLASRLPESAAADPGMARPILRCERFVLEVPVRPREGRDASAPLPARPIGFVEWRRRVDPSGSVLLERDIWYQEDGLRLRQTERLIPAENAAELVPIKMIWREQLGALEDGRPGHSRSLVVSPSRKPGEWTLLDRFAGRSDRTSMRPPETGPAFPLQLIEEIREGSTPHSVQFSAMSKSIEAISVSIEPSEGDRRIVELRRPDGLLAMRLTLDGDEIQSFRFQETGTVARRVDEVEWRRLKDRLNTSH